MLVTVIMLGIALLPTGDAFWLENVGERVGMTEGVPALCYFRKLDPRSEEGQFAPDAQLTTSMLVSMLVLFFGYVTRLFKLLFQATAFMRLWSRTKPGTALKKTIENASRRNALFEASIHGKATWKINYIVYNVLYIILRAAFDLYESMLWEVRLSTVLSSYHPVLLNSYFACLR